MSDTFFHFSRRFMADAVIFSINGLRINVPGKLDLTKAIIIIVENFGGRISACLRWRIHHASESGGQFCDMSLNCCQETHWKEGT